MASNVRPLRIADVSKKTSLGKSIIWLKMGQGSFPNPTKLSPAINVWNESDIDKWIASCFESAPQNQIVNSNEA